MFILVCLFIYFSFLLGAAIPSTAPFRLVSQTGGGRRGNLFVILLVLFAFSASVFLSVLCRFFIVGGVSGSGGAECVSAPHLCRPSNILSAAVCSGGEEVHSRGGDPLRRRGKSKIVLQRSDGVTSLLYALNE